MNNMISAEIFKFKRSKAFFINLYVVIGISILLVAMMYMVTVIEPGDMTNSSLFNGMAVDAANLPFVAFNGMYQLVMLCLGIFACVDIVKDFDNGCIKNAMTVGRTRYSWIAAKLMNLLIASALFTVCSTAVFTIGLMIKFEWITPVNLAYLGRLLSFLATQIIIYFAYGAIFAMIAFLLRNVGGSIGIAIGFTVAESLILQLMALINLPILNTLAKVLPITMVDRLNGIAFGTQTFGAYGIILLIAAGIIAITTAITVFTFQKRDI